MIEDEIRGSIKMQPKSPKGMTGEAATDALRKAYEQTELLLSSITSILIGVNEQGLVTHWNQVAEKTFGIPLSRVLSRPFSECGIQWDYGRVAIGIRECRAKGEPVRIDDVSFQRRDGQKGFLGLTVIPLKREAEGSLECILFGADITQRKKMEELKNEFISTVSHELRTPLTVIKEGVSQVVEGILGEINEDQRRFLTISLEGIDRLGRIVDDLLDISKIEAGKLELRRGWVDFVSLVKGISLAFDYQAKEKKLEIRTRLPKTAVAAYVDKDKIIQVFTNLVSNALKFTEKGRIEIWVADKRSVVECGISDTGVGIAREDLPKVFDKFQQFSHPSGSGQKGTGLGLAICKGIVELHHGQISVDSKLGEGTRFKFTLPKYTPKELFKEQIAEGLKTAMRQESCLSIIVFDISNYEIVRQALAEEKVESLIHELLELVKGGLRHPVDVAIKDTRALLILLPSTQKEEALMVAGRIQQTLDTYLSKRKLKKQVALTCRVATFPDDGNTEEELLRKLEGS